MWLVHSSTNAPVFGSYVPVAPPPLTVDFGAASNHFFDTQSHARSACCCPGAWAWVLDTGLGAPWLKFWLFHEAAYDARSAVSFPLLSRTVGGGTLVLVCRSVSLVEMLNFTPKNLVGVVMAPDSELPPLSNPGVGCDW